MWTGHGRALHLCWGTLNFSERRQVAPMDSSSVVTVCKSAQCILPPTVLDCVRYIHFNRAQAQHETIKRSIVKEVAICGTAKVLAV